MAEIDAKAVKAFRDKTGAGMMDAKRALAEADGDEDKAIEILRAKGMKDVAKRKDRVASQGQVHSYMHPGNKVGVLVEMNCETDFVAMNEAFQEVIHEIALHIAFADPQYVSRDEVPEEESAKERRYLEGQARESGKPENIIERMVEGQMATFYKKLCLLDQISVRDDKKTIGDIVHDLAVKTGENIAVRRFARFEVGK